jgi:hypothetical protein
MNKVRVWFGLCSLEKNPMQYYFNIKVKFSYGVENSCPDECPLVHQGKLCSVDFAKGYTV